MLSPDLQKEPVSKYYLHKELSESYDKMIKVKAEAIRHELTCGSGSAKQDVHSVGLGFALSILNSPACKQ